MDKRERINLIENRDNNVLKESRIPNFFQLNEAEERFLKENIGKIKKLTEIICRKRGLEGYVGDALSHALEGFCLALKIDNPLLRPDDAKIKKFWKFAEVIIKYKIINFFRIFAPSRYSGYSNTKEGSTFADPRTNTLLSKAYVDISKQAFRDEEIKREVWNAIERIEKTDPRLARFIKLYFYEGLNQKEIGKILNFGEPRASQLYKKAKQKLREILQNKKDDSSKVA